MKHLKLLLLFRHLSSFKIHLPDHYLKMVGHVWSLTINYPAAICFFMKLNYTATKKIHNTINNQAFELKSAPSKKFWIPGKGFFCLILTNLINKKLNGKIGWKLYYWQLFDWVISPEAIPRLVVSLADFFANFWFVWNCSRLWAKLWCILYFERNELNTGRRFWTVVWCFFIFQSFHKSKYQFVMSLEIANFESDIFDIGWIYIELFSEINWLMLLQQHDGTSATARTSER